MLFKGVGEGETVDGQFCSNYFSNWSNDFRAGDQPLGGDEICIMKCGTRTAMYQEAIADQLIQIDIMFSMIRWSKHKDKQTSSNSLSSNQSTALKVNMRTWKQLMSMDLDEMDMQETAVEDPQQGCNMEQQRYHGDPNTIVDPDLKLTPAHTGTRPTLMEFQDLNGGPVCFGGQQEANQNAGTEESIDVGDSDKEDDSAQDSKETNHKSFISVYFCVYLSHYMNPRRLKALEDKLGYATSRKLLQRLRYKICVLSRFALWEKSYRYKVGLKSKQRRMKEELLLEIKQVLSYGWEKWPSLRKLIRDCYTPMETQKPVSQGCGGHDVDCSLRDIDYAEQILTGHPQQEVVNFLAGELIWQCKKQTCGLLLLQMHKRKTTEAQPTPSPAPTSEAPLEPQPDSSPAPTSEVPFEHQPDPSPRPSPTTTILILSP
ncbi:hypothetical protein Tco_1254089 [Tanacetum coccineum]